MELCFKELLGIFDQLSAVLILLTATIASNKSNLTKQAVFLLSASILLLLLLQRHGSQTTNSLGEPIFKKNGL